MNGGPAGLMRRRHMSDGMGWLICPAGPLSRSPTFLPALASTAANTEPDAPAPAITTSTFSCVAISPPPVRLDMRQIGDAEALVALHGSVDDVDRIAAQHEIDLPRRWTLPAGNLVLAQLIDEIVPLGGRQRGETFAAQRHARLVHAADRAAIEIDVGRLHVDEIGRASCRER